MAHPFRPTLKLLAGLALLAAVPSGQAQTTVSGPITTNTTWTLAGSPYEIIGVVNVISGVTLTIEPGVEVAFSGGSVTELQMEGALIAEGTAELMIYFHARPLNGSGGGLYFGSGSSGSLHHVVIERMGPRALTLNSESSAIEVTDCEIRDNSGTAIYISTLSNPLITRCNIVGNRPFALANPAIGHTVYAEDNWWGDASGPYHPTLNPDGAGDPIWGGCSQCIVDFTPWRTSPVQIQNVVTQPALALSTAQVAPGGSVQITGSGFTPSSDVTFVLSGPGGFETRTEVLTADGAGAFPYTFQTDETTPAGYYGTFARDEATNAYTSNHTFLIQEEAAPPFALQITKPVPGEGSGLSRSGETVPLLGDGVLVEWLDQMRRITDPQTYVNAVFRLYRYKIERSDDGGATWTLVGYEDGTGVYDEIRTISQRIDLPAGTDWRVRVTDEFEPGRFDVSGPFEVTDEFDQEITAEFMWDYSYSDPAEVPVGVAADGVGRFFVKVTDRYPDNGRNVETVTVTLADPFPVGSLDIRTHGRVKKITNVAETTAWSAAANTGGGLSEPLSAPTLGTDGGREFWFWYVAPEDFVRDLAEDGERAGRTVLANITATYSDGSQTTVPLARAIEVVRPPLMLVHGLNGDPGDWNDFRNASGVRFRDDTRYHVRFVPQMDAAGHFDDNADHLLGEPAGETGDSFASAIALLRAKGYACNQVEYVGHSMGGNMLRAAVQNDAWTQTRNYLSGFVHRAVTLDSPHHGTELANLLVDITDEVNQFDAALLVLILGKGTSFYDVVSSFPFHIAPSDAVEDLTLGGYPLTPTTTPPLHFVTSDIIAGSEDYHEIDPGTLAAVNLGNVFLGLMGLLRPAIVQEAETWAPDLSARLAEYNGIFVGTTTALGILDVAGEVYGNDDFATNGDVVVSLDSQRAGLPVSTSVSEFSGLAHSPSTSSPAVTNDPSVGDRVDGLLNASVTSTQFRAGFPAGPPAPRRPRHDGPAPRLLVSDRLSLTLSAEYVTVGDRLQMTVGITDTTGFRGVDVFFQDSGIASATAAPLLAFDLPVTGAVLDSVTVIAVATFVYPDSVVVSTASDRIYVGPGGAPLSFAATPDLHLLTVGDQIHPDYQAVFPTFLSRPGDDALNVTVEDPSVMTYDALIRSFSAVGEGSSIAVVTYRGLADTLRFAVGAAPVVGSGVTVTLEPIGGPIEIPAAGGRFRFRATLTNTTGATTAVKFWTELVLPNGNSSAPMAGPVTVTLAPGESRQFTLRQSIPARAPAGSYTYVGHVGLAYPTSQGSDSFLFMKLPSALAASDSDRDAAPRMARAAPTPGAGIQRAGSADRPQLAAHELPASKTVPFVFDPTEWLVIDEATGLPFGVEAAAAAPTESAATAGEALPLTSTLFAAAPNPFNPTTLFRYDVATPGYVEIVVYDVLGREVARLVDEMKEPGRHQASFDASRLASGFYVVRMSTGAFVQTQRVTRIR